MYDFDEKNMSSNKRIAFQDEKQKLLKRHGYSWHFANASIYPDASSAPDTKICSFICIPETIYNDRNGKNVNNVLKIRLFTAKKCLVFYAREKDYTSGAWVTALMEEYAEIEISSNDLFRKYLTSSVCLATHSSKHTILATSNWDIRQKGDKYSFKLHIPFNKNSRYAPCEVSSADYGTFTDSLDELSDDDRCKLRTLFDYVDESNEAVTLPAVSYMLMCQCNSILHVLDMKPKQLMNIVLPANSKMRILLLSLGNSVNIQFSEDKPECSHFTKFDFSNDYIKTIFEDRCDSVIIGDTFLGNSKTEALHRQFSNSLKPLTIGTDFKELIDDRQNSVKKDKHCSFMPIFISELNADSRTYFNIDGHSATVSMDKLQDLREHEQTRLFVTKQFFVYFAEKLNSFTKKELYSYFHKISENANRYYLLNGFRYENDTAFFCGCLQFFFVEYLKFLNENYDDAFNWDTLNYWYSRAEPVFVKMVKGTDDENVSETVGLLAFDNKRLTDSEVESFFAEVYRLYLDNAFEAENDYDKAKNCIGFLREGNICINHEVYAKKYKIDSRKLKNTMDYIKNNDTPFNGLVDNKGKQGHYATRFGKKGLIRSIGIKIDTLAERHKK